MIPLPEVPGTGASTGRGGGNGRGGSTFGKTFVMIGLLGLLGIAGAAVVVMTVFWHFGRGLPEYRQLATYEPAVATRTYTADGLLLAQYASEDRRFIPIGRIPPLVVDAFISAEDQNFRKHVGIDAYGIARAMVQNIGNLYQGRRIVGASTITQQLAKTFFLTSSVSLERKIREAILALRIERALSKDRILELYLNEIYLGARSYGVAAAASNYFAKSLDELTLDEAAYIAGLPKGPNNYHPVRNPYAAHARRAYVLRRMAEDGIVPIQDAAAAMDAPFNLATTRVGEGEILAPHFAEEVRRWLEESFSARSLYEGGLAVTTTLVPELQRIANKTLRDGLDAHDRRRGYRGPIARLGTPGSDWDTRLVDVLIDRKRPEWKAAMVLEVNKNSLGIGFVDRSRGILNADEIAWALSQEGVPSDIFRPGDVILVEETDESDAHALRQASLAEGALVALDPRSGRVLALVGGYTGEGTGFNRATQAHRQPGSTFKPFVYLAALEEGRSPASLVLDAPIVIDQGDGLENWKPQNYSGKFYGPSTLRTGLEKSRNVMTVRLASTIGIDRVVDAAERFGLGSPQPFLSTALGSAEVTPLELAAAYAALANGGYLIKPAFVERVQDKHGTTLHRRDERSCPACQTDESPGEAPPALAPYGEVVADPVSTFQITWMLKGVVENGTARRLNKLNLPLAGKTGTADDFVNAWFVGFSPELVVCVYIGYDQPRSLGQGETGGRAAVPVFEAFMREALRDKTTSPFPVPNGVYMIRIDADTGQRPGNESKRVIFEAFAQGTGPNVDEETIQGFKDEIY